MRAAAILADRAPTMRPSPNHAWLTVLALVAGCGADPEPPRPPDVVLVVIDTLRVDFLGLGRPASEGERATAPFLAELAADAVLFRNACSTSSWTAPATASVFTGLYPPVHGVEEGFVLNAQRRSAPGAPGAPELRGLPGAPATLPERLHAAGYRTLGLASNVNIGPELGFDRGFERFHRARQADARELGERLLEWLAEPDPRPTFVYLHLNDVHRPYDLREPFHVPGDAADEDRARYRSEIGHVDAILRELHDRLGWRDAALVVVSDHGEAFGEHGMRGHGPSLHGELNRVLAIVRPPGWTGGGRTVEENVSLLDVRPTVLALAGLAEPALPGAGGVETGRSLLPLVHGDPIARAAFAGRTLFAHRGPAGRALWAAIRGPWKLIEDERTGARRLFDVAADPRELVDRSADEPAVAAELALELERFRAAARRLEGKAVRVDLDEALRRHLDALGYADGDG